VNKFIAYFQAFSNTYAQVGKLYSLYTEALSVPDVVGLSIGTRPDIVPDSVLDMIQELARDSYSWIEYGLQSIHHDTLQWINRGHSYGDFVDAVYRTQGRSINIAVHIILGLPGESREDMLETVKSAAQLPVQGIKIHHLYITRGSPIEKIYNNGSVHVFEEDEYVELAADVIEQLPPGMVIHRIMGSSNPKELIAPHWTNDKARVINKINAELEKRNTCQGGKYSVKKHTLNEIIAE
jgi:hypothetical protein